VNFVFFVVKEKFCLTTKAHKGKHKGTQRFAQKYIK